MICKNCIHKDVCHKIEHYGRNLETDESCDHFRDLTKMIELPCAIGDTVYSIWEDEEGKLQIEEIEAIDVSVQKVWIGDVYFSCQEIGVNVFFTREEAEKAIKERESLGN